MFSSKRRIPLRLLRPSAGVIAALLLTAAVQGEADALRSIRERYNEIERQLPTYRALALPLTNDVGGVFDTARMYFAGDELRLVRAASGTDDTYQVRRTYYWQAEPFFALVEGNSVGGRSWAWRFYFSHGALIQTIYRENGADAPPPPYSNKVAAAALADRDTLTRLAQRALLGEGRVGESQSRASKHMNADAVSSNDPDGVGRIYAGIAVTVLVCLVVFAAWRGQIRAEPGLGRIAAVRRTTRHVPSEPAPAQTAAAPVAERPSESAGHRVNRTDDDQDRPKSLFDNELGTPPSRAREDPPSTAGSRMDATPSSGVLRRSSLGESSDTSLQVGPVGRLLAIAVVGGGMWWLVGLFMGGSRWEGEFRQLQRLQYSLLGTSRVAEKAYALSVSSGAVRWEVTDLESSQTTVICTGRFAQPDGGRNITLRIRMDCRGEGAFFETRDKVLVYTESSDTWSVNTNHLLMELRVQLARD